MDEKNFSKTEELACEIMAFARDSLLVNLRFLDSALDRVPLEISDSRYSTDGMNIFYEPRQVLLDYKAEKTLPCRNYLHILMHCILGHITGPSEEEKITDKSLWDIACDIAAEYVICGLALSVTASIKEQRQKRVFTQIQEHSGLMTAEKIYRYLLRERPDAAGKDSLNELFAVDRHNKWIRDDALIARWKSVSRRMQVDMETFARRQGAKAGALIANLREANREVSDYAGFLRQFAVQGEGLKTDPDEFDYILYSYGLRLTGGKSPFIEPTEYREDTRLRTFLVAISTEAGFSAEKVKIFIRNTWEILKNTENYFSKVAMNVMTFDGVNGHLDFVKDDEDLSTCLESLEHQLPCAPSPVPEWKQAEQKDEKTNLLPLFNKVDEMLKNKEVISMKGLIVMCSQQGIFPYRMPPYHVAFVFVNKDYSVPEVPPWGIRMIMQEDELL